MINLNTTKRKTTRVVLCYTGNIHTMNDYSCQKQNEPESDQYPDLNSDLQEIQHTEVQLAKLIEWDK